jgi:membrane-associated phospholipid phosphatase
MTGLDEIAPPVMAGQRWLLMAAVVLVAAGVAVHASGMDVPWILRVHANAHSPFAVLLWSSITVLGLGSAALVLVLAADRGGGRIAGLLLPVFVLGALLAHVPKWLLATPRPVGSSVAPHLHVIGHPFSGAVSMPSGHAVTAGAAAILLAMALGSKRPFAVALVVLIAAVVSWSRVVVGAHWPSDVLVGAGLGMIAALAVLRAVASPSFHRPYDALVRGIRATSGQVAVAGFEVAAGVALLRESTGYPAGKLMVALIATVAVASALSRCRVVLDRRAAARIEPMEPT